MNILFVEAVPILMDESWIVICYGLWRLYGDKTMIIELLSLKIIRNNGSCAVTLQSSFYNTKLF